MGHRCRWCGDDHLHVAYTSSPMVVNRVAGGSQMPFERTLNAYRGRSHACRCFSPPAHDYLGLGWGSSASRWSPALTSRTV